MPSPGRYDRDPLHLSPPHPARGHFPAVDRVRSARRSRAVRLPDFFTRLHGPTKATTLGVGTMVLASAIYFTATQPGVSLHEIAVMVFLFITAPVTAHLLAKAALHRHGDRDAKCQNEMK